MLQIEASRLILKPLNRDHLDALVVIAGDPEVRRYIRGLPQSREQAWQRVLSAAGHWHLFGCGRLGIFNKCSGELIGEVGCSFFERSIDTTLNTIPEASWLLASSATGCGFAQEAMSALLVSYERSGGRRVASLIDATNEASIRLATKLRFELVRDVDYRGCSHKLLVRQSNNSNISTRAMGE